MQSDVNKDELARIAAGEDTRLDLWSDLRIYILEQLDAIAHTQFPIPNLPPSPQRKPPQNDVDHAPSSQDADKENTKPVTPEHGRKVNGSENATGDDDEDVTMTKAQDDDAGAAADTKPSDGDAHVDARPTQTDTTQTTATPSSQSLPTQLADMLGDVKSHLETFTVAPPHTVQRLAELILQPRAHYRALATYLHAVDRVVRVTSAINRYPLPPAILDMSSVQINGTGSHDQAAESTTANSINSSIAAAAVGSDEALGGALLTPIPWLTRRSPSIGDVASLHSMGSPADDAGGASFYVGGVSGAVDLDLDDDNGGSSSSSSSNVGSGGGVQIHSEGTETIDGPNGVGSIETVSVSVNGVPSIGHARGVTQGELLRQEQRAGVVPVSQLTPGSMLFKQQQQKRFEVSNRIYEGLTYDMRRARLDLKARGEELDRAMRERRGEEGVADNTDTDEKENNDGDGGDEKVDNDDGRGEKEVETDEQVVPHARGPEEIGVDDTGPQSERARSSILSESGAGLDTRGIDVAAAVGRPPEQEEHPGQVGRKEGDDQSEGDDEGGKGGGDGEKGVVVGESGGDVGLSSDESTGTKREAEEEAGGEAVKKTKEE